MTRRRAAAECIAIVVGFLAVREGIVRLVATWRDWDGLVVWSGLAFYAIWATGLAVVAVRWPATGRPPLRPRFERPLLTAAIAVGVVVATDYLYGFELWRAVTGQIAFHAPGRWQYVVNAALAAPIVEEWLFRGVLWKALADRMRGPAATLVPLVVTSTLFALWHLGSIFAPTWITASGTYVVYHGLFGALMGVLRWRLRSIGGGVAVHALYNGLYTVIG